MQTLDARVAGVPTLAELEAEVTAGLDLVKQGANRMRQALCSIRDNRLWAKVLDAYENPVYPTFKAYLKIRWNLEESYGHELAAAGQTINEMIDSGIPESSIPEEASQLREYGKAEPADRPAILHTAQQIAGGKPTAENVAAARRIVKPEPGQRYEVVEPSNPHHGKIITANEVKGGVVVGLEPQYPFMPAELRPVDLPPAAPKAERPTVRDRLTTCENLLKECLECHLPSELHAKIEAALSLR